MLLRRRGLLHTSSALSRTATGYRERPQVILTPSSITDYVRDVFGGSIALDPCPYFGTEETVNAADVCDDGLTEPWRDRTFVNPPFKQLKLWLEKACSYKDERIIVLAPVRTHRKWFRSAMRTADAVLLLNPVTFVGYEATFPAPLCLLFFNNIATYDTPLGEFL